MSASSYSNLIGFVNKFLFHQCPISRSIKCINCESNQVGEGRPTHFIEVYPIGGRHFKFNTNIRCSVCALQLYYVSEDWDVPV